MSDYDGLEPHEVFSVEDYDMISRSFGDSPRPAAPVSTPAATPERDDEATCSRAETQRNHPAYVEIHDVNTACS